MVRVKDFQGPVVGISEKMGWGPPIQTNMSKMRCPHMTTCPATETSMGSSRYTYIYIYVYIYIRIYIYMIMKYSQYVCMILYDYQIYQNLIEIGYLIFFSGPGRGGSFTIPSLMSCLAPDTSWTSFCSCAHCPPGFTRAPRCWASQVTSKSN